jgi:hypothetical protein
MHNAAGIHITIAKPYMSTLTQPISSIRLGPARKLGPRVREDDALDDGEFFATATARLRERAR